MKKDRIGLFGGTFNPIHEGHIKVAQIVQQRAQLDKILFIPSYEPPHKGSADMAPAVHRLAMVKLALEPYPKFEASSIEIEEKGKSYSIVTLHKINKIYPKARIFFIVGVDAFLEIDTWKDYEEVLTQCFFIVVSRPGYCLEDAMNVLNGKYMKNTYGVSGNEKLDELKLSLYTIFLLPIQALEISSSAIRAKIRTGKFIKNLVSPAVEAYIREYNLYKW